MHSPDHLLSSCLGPKEEQGCTLASDSFHTDQQQCADDQPAKNFTFFLTVWITVSISATKQLTTMQVGREVQFKGLEDFSANPVTLRGNILRMR